MAETESPDPSPAAAVVTPTDKRAAKKPAAAATHAERPAPVEAAAVVVDPTLPVPHAHAKDDVHIWVVKSTGQYGLVDRGEQTLYEVHPADNAPLGRAGIVRVAASQVEKFLRNVEGSVLVKPGTMTPEQEAAEAARPVGRRAGPPLSAEEVTAATEQAKGAAAATAIEEPAAKAPAKKAAAKK